MSKKKKRFDKVVSPEINKTTKENLEDSSGKLITASELRKMDKLKHGGHPSRNQNYRVHKTAHDFE